MPLPCPIPAPRGSRCREGGRSPAAPRGPRSHAPVGPPGALRGPAGVRGRLGRARAARTPRAAPTSPAPGSQGYREPSHRGCSLCRRRCRCGALPSRGASGADPQPGFGGSAMPRWGGGRARPPAPSCISPPDAARRSSLAAELSGPGIAPAPLPAAGWSGSELAPAPGPRPRHPSGDAAVRAGRPRSCLGCRSGSSVQRGIRPRRGWGIAVRKMSLPNIKPLFCCFVKESSNPPFPAKNCQNYYDYFCQPSSLKCFACQALDCTVKFGARNVSCELGVADAKSPSNPAGK